MTLEARPVLGKSCAGNLQLGEPVTFHAMFFPRSMQVEGDFWTQVTKGCV
ncbi:MAG: hypothetical protein IT384_03910 [Deltaproteobacteria bacterium]|nr:hypothetical protein [Deltaproteobacteria bacterium]